MSLGVLRGPTSGPVLVFELGGESADDERGGFGIELASVVQVLEPAALTLVPLAPAMVLGIMSHRGRIVTVIDPAPLLRGATKPVMGPETRIVLLRQGQRQSGNVGLLVARVREIVPASEMKDSEVSPGSGTGWVAQRGRRLINVIEVEPLLETLVRAFEANAKSRGAQGVTE